jgi:hypothetical protein
MDRFNFLSMSFEPISIAAKDAFLSSAPPRLIPREISNQVMPWRDTWLPCLMGVAVLIFGLAMSGFLMPRHLVSEWRLEKEAVEVVSGEILLSEETKTKVNGSRIWKYEFAYRPVGESKQKGTAYTSGKRWDSGGTVDVRYLLADPRIAVPVGARLDDTTPWFSLILIFPLLGLSSIVSVFYQRIWKRRLLSHGIVGKAVVNAVVRSNIQDSGQPTYQLRMTLCGSGIPFQKRTRDAAEIDAAEAKLKSGEPLNVLYDSNKPRRFFVLDCWATTVAALPTERFFRENPLPSEVSTRNPAAVVAIDAFLRMPTPQRIPKEIFKKAAGSSGMLGLQFFGAVFFTFGLFFSWMTLPFYLPKQWLLEVAPAASVSGKITAVEDSKGSVNGVAVVGYRFSFRPENAVAREGLAYRTGGDWVVGTPVTVRYLSAFPSVARPEGARMGVSPPGGVFVVVFPLVGALVLLGPMLLRARKIQVLRNGQVSTARVMAVEKTTVQINNQSQYKIHLSRTSDGSQIIRRTCSLQEISFAATKWKDAELVKILYLPQKSNGVLLPESWNE